MNKVCRERHRHAITGKMAGMNNPSSKKVLCIETGEVFETMKDASLKYGVVIGGICNVCKGKQKTAGFFEEMNCRLTWKYYE